MDPISIAIATLIASGAGPAAAAGSAGAVPAIGAAATAVATAPAWVVPAGVVAGTGAAGSLGATGLLGAAAANNPFTAQGLQNAGADAFNGAVGSAADIINPLNIPGVHLHVN